MKSLKKLNANKYDIKRTNEDTSEISISITGTCLCVMQRDCIKAKEIMQVEKIIEADMLPCLICSKYSGNL